ncbi:MAG TPA: type IV pilus secretin PilQ [Thermoanaerobaculia bacterium]|nr:type IV pilus secretin PilQ [Thermoanaerobaculia bacterium]
MGDVVNRRQSDAWQRLIASVALLAVAAGAGCTSSKHARVVEATPAAASEAPAETAKAPAPAAVAAAEIKSLDLREGAPGVYIDLQASAPLVWTSFRNADGKVVVELPNAVPRAGLADLAPEEGLVASLKVENSTEGSRPMTRLVISTRQEAEHSVTAEGSNLRVQLVPVEEQAAASRGKLQFEPIAGTPPSPAPAPAAAAAPAKAPSSPSSPEPSPAPAPSPASAAASPSPSAGRMAGLGTPDQPAVAPAPKGPAATRLEGIEVLASDGGAVVRIAGDGEFPYATFALDEPERFVIDLDGVINRSARATLSVDGGIVERVRVAQFKPYPKPVSRVVFDLKGKVVPVIERTADALVVTFPSSPGGATAASMEAPAPQPSAPSAKGPSKAPAKPAVMPPHEQPAPRQTSHPGPAVSDLALAPKPAAGKPATTTTQYNNTPGIEVEEASPAPPVAPAAGKAAPKASATLTAAASKGGKTSGKSSVQIQPAASKEVPATGTTAPAPLDSFQPQAMGSGEKTYTGEPIDLKVTNADVTEVLRTFAQISGLNIIVQPGVSGTVTAELDNVPWDQALEQVLKINALSYELDGNVMRIAPVSILKQEASDKQTLAQAQALSIPLRTVFRRLSYANAQNIAGLLRTGSAGLLSQRGSVIVDDRTNSLIIKELPSFMDTVISVIDRLDTPEPQVMIEARIIETTKQFSRNLGIAWGFNGVADAAHGNTTGLVFPNNGTVKGGVNLATGGQNGTLNLTLGNVLNTFNLDVALNAAENEGLVHVLSAPKVATLNNQQAQIQSGVQIPVQTIANNTVTVQYVNATLRLEVTPQVTAEGTVVMTINIEKREPQLAFLVPGATNAPISTKEASTKLLVRDGGTAVIGGIYKVTTNQGEDRVPGLANIPIIGHLFRNKSRSETNDELLIFITPRVIKL